MASLFVELYPWLYMPVYMHKILIHGHQIIKMAFTAIGELSEEASEARLKNLENVKTEN